MRERPVALVIIGAPSSGKSTLAQEIVEINPNVDYEIIERDIIRQEIGGNSRRGFYRLSESNRDLYETYVSRLHTERIIKAYNAGKNIIISDTNINKHFRHELYSRLWAIGFVIQVECINNHSLDTLYELNARRHIDHQVNNSIIERMYIQLQKQYQDIIIEQELLSLRNWYRTGRVSDGDVIICDVDDTIAYRTDREPFEWHKVESDAPHYNNIALVHAAIESAPNTKVMFFSGRSDECYQDTYAWINKHMGLKKGTWSLHMREQGDHRKDWIVKGEMYQALVHNTYNVLYVFDDRQQVVDYWDNVGLPVIQVNQSKY